MLPSRTRSLLVVMLGLTAFGVARFVEQRFRWPTLAAWAVAAALFGSALLLPTALGLTATARERRRFGGLTLAQIDALSGEGFERWVAGTLRRAGFRVESTARSRDYGVDLIARRRRHRIAIEVKRRGQPIGNDVVRSIVAGAEYHGCGVAAVVTQAGFTAPARQQAEQASLPVVLLGRDALASLGRALRAAC